MMSTVAAGAMAADMDRGLGDEPPSTEATSFYRPRPPADVPGAAPGTGVRSHWKTAKSSIAVRSLGRRDKTGRMLTRKTVGRDTEVKDLKRKLKALSHGQDGGIIMYEAGAGMGKSHMCREAIKQADRMGLKPLRGYCSALKDSTPYFPFQCLLEELFEVTFLPVHEARAKIMAQVAEQWPHLSERIGLLNTILPFHFDEHMKVSVLRGFARAEGTKRYLLELLQCATQSLEKMVLIFEDVHWMDSLSWSLLADLSSSIHPLLIIVTHREWIEEFRPPPEYDELLESERTEMYPLKGLSRRDTHELAVRVLRVESLPEVILAAIVNRGGGNPFYIEEVVKYMKDTKVIELEGKTRCVPGKDFGARGSLPDNGLSVVTERYSKLDEPLVLILKIGAVMSGVFTEAMIKGMHPFPSQLGQLTSNLDKLQRKGFLSTDNYQRVLDDSWERSDESETLYSFSHNLLEQMVYSMMPLKQRQQLHRGAARYFEAAHSRMKISMSPDDSDSSDSDEIESVAEERTEDENNIPGFSLALAHHWSNTDAPPMAAEFLVEAGRDALKRHGNMEAVEHFQQAFDLVPEGKAAHVTVSRAKLFVLAGNAFFSLGQTEMAETHYREGLRLMAQPFLTKVPLGIRLPLPTMVTLKLGMLRAVRMVRRGRSRIVVEDEDAAHCFERLAKVHENRKWLNLLLSLKQVQLVEKAGPNPSLLRGCANVCYTAAILQKFKTAETYCRLAMKFAEEVDDLSSLAVANRVCGLYSIGVGQWSRAQKMLQAGAGFASKVHDWHGWYESVGYLALALTLMGQFTEAEAHVNMALDSVRNAGHTDSLAWVLCGYIACTYPKGPVVHQGIDNLELLEECLGSDREGDGPLPHVLLVAGKGLAAIARLRRGETSEAEKLAMEHLFYVEQASHESEEDVQGRVLLEQLNTAAALDAEEDFEQQNMAKEQRRNNKAALKSMFTALPRAAVVEVAIELWDKSLKHEHHVMAHRALSSFKELAHIFPVLRPRFHLYEGMIERLDGHTYLMMDQWRKCLVVARQMDLPWEVACAHHQLAEWGVHTKAEEELSSELERRAHVSAAQRAFAELDTKERANRALDGVSWARSGDVFGRIGAEMREQEGFVVFDPAAANHANVCVQQAATDSLAVRLHLNPPRHCIERGRNKTEVWPELRHEPTKLMRLKTYIAYGLSGKRWKNREKDNMKCGFKSVVGALLTPMFCGCWCLCPIDRDAKLAMAE